MFTDIKNHKTSDHLYPIFNTGYSLACDSGWIEGPLDDVDTCYEFVTDRRETWSKAQGLCWDMGGRLATLETEAEIVWIKGYHSHNLILRRLDLWIGGYEKDGVWYWKGDVTDSPILITDWGKTQPDDYHGDHGELSGCLSLFGGDYRDPHDWFRFDDNHCDLHKAGFICEKPVKY